MSSAHRFLDLFDLDKLEQYVKISEKTIAKKKDMERQEEVAKYKRDVQVTSKSVDKLQDELVSVLNAASDSFQWLILPIRDTIVSRMPDSPTKSVLVRVSNRLREREKEQIGLGGPLNFGQIAARVRALRESSSQDNLQQNSKNKKEA